jgi:hypothetical protein
VIRFTMGTDSGRNTGWTEIRPKRFLASRRFESLDNNTDGADGRVIYVRRNGLDGRVTRVEVSAVPPAGHRGR